jgi:preprotein translocase subunit SecA
LDHLRQAINLRAYAQRDPLNEYKREAFELFEEMLVNLRQQVTSVLSHVELRMEPPPPPPGYGEMVFGEPGPAERELAMAEASAPAASSEGAGRTRPRRPNGHDASGASGRRERAGERTAVRAPWAGTSRNAACPCGSGKKFKHCHGRI